MAVERTDGGAGGAGTVSSRSHRRDLRAFLVLTFGLTWGIGALGLLFLDQLAFLFEPLFVLAVSAPSLAAFVLTARWGGRRAVVDLVRSGLRWRVGWRWYLVGLVLIPAIGLVARAIEGGVTGDGWTLSGAAPLALFAALPLALVTDPGPVGEEFGFRGYALPRLVALGGWRTAAIVLGGIWWLWHLPAFFISLTPQSQLSMAPMVVQWFAVSVLFAYVWIHTGSVLVAGILPHLTLNLVATVPEVGASASCTAPFFVLVAVALLAFGRDPAGADRPSARHRAVR